MTAPDKAPELKPCPFCGEYGSIIDDPNHTRAWRGGCSDEDCPAFDIIYEMSEAKAITAWNRRADVADVADAMAAAACETLVKAAGTFCWNRYDESRMKTPAVFTSHTHQRIEEALRQAVPADARAALAEAEPKAWEAGRDAVLNCCEVQLSPTMRTKVAALKKEPEA